MHEVAIRTTDEGEVFHLFCGLDTNTIRIFTEKSCDTADTELQNNTSDYVRFCEHTYDEWYAKERYPFVLMSEGKELAGIVWLGPKEPPAVEGFLSAEKEWDTFAIRTYMPFRGKRLARPFASTALEIYRTLKPGRTIWLEADSENTSARALYTKLDFKEIGYTDTNRVVMVLE